MNGPATAFEPLSRRALDAPSPPSGWGESLARLSACAENRIGCRAVIFLDLPRVLRAALDPVYRTWLAGQILLPAGRLAAALLGLVRPGQPVASLVPHRFVPSLLTFMEHSRHILLIGPDSARLEAARDRFRAHAPWHVFSVIVLETTVCGRARSAMDGAIERLGADVVIADAGDPETEIRLQTYLSYRHDGLVLLAQPAFAAGAGSARGGVRLIAGVNRLFARKL
ncbi:hypothetical protein [Rhizobium sp. CSW-27]|uniref:hypothetical protein n=1 Tax=Rhizobium sp. CSW-27 TaxID=2839985 RepID=UPI001C0336F6|nr:hypothetical protein [Rhizobium sp. CSW-27]MBT9371911.1 hypothetical protein [Rhizobium sp. CSW-27]